ncbi:MAG: methyltransferase [Mycobacterium sp.]
MAPTREHHDAVYRLTMAGWETQVTRTLARLSVAEHLQVGPLTASEIADKLSSDPEMTYRLLRAAAALGFVVYNADTSRFAGTAMLEVLCGESALSLKHYAQIAGSDVFWLPSRRMAETVLRGRNHSDEVLGGSPFEYFARNEAEARVFSAAMTEISAPVISEVIPLIDVGEARLAVDVGGADGAFVASLLATHEQMHGVVLDLPQVMAGVVSESRRRGLTDRMTGMQGDFFEEVPPADIYLLKFILHDWDDESCKRILSNIRAAMRPESRLFIVEMTADEGSLEAAMMDMGMLTAFTGQERESRHLGSLVTASGLRLARTCPLHRPYLMLEAVSG